ncbi:MAG: formate/nitrite transporter family protein [Crocinitomicaceae bacterium]|nr:formate/nitrite transporter family protein [Crocinitomicaceae bacterium]
MNPETQNNTDAYNPSEIAQRIEQVGVTKARLPLLKLFVLALLAGAFISMGALFYIVVTTNGDLGFGISRLIGGITFSLGLILVVIAGAELFTGNNLMAMAWASRKIKTAELLRNWMIVYTGNAVGAILTVVLVWLADIDSLSSGEVGNHAIAIAKSKSELSFLVIMIRGILCNALVCIAVWIVMAGHTVTDKILAIIFPVSAFVAIGFEHSVANWFFLPYGFVLSSSDIDITGMFYNILASTIGNIIGGTLLVSSVYYLAYLRKVK